MRKMRRKEKKMHASASIYPLKISQSKPHNTNDNDIVYTDDDFASKYQVMRFHDNDNDIDNGNNKNDNNYEYAFPDDIVSRIYYAAITGLGLYVLYKILYTNRKRR